MIVICACCGVIFPAEMRSSGLLSLTIEMNLSSPVFITTIFGVLWIESIAWFSDSEVTLTVCFSLLMVNATVSDLRKKYVAVVCESLIDCVATLVVAVACDVVDVEELLPLPPVFELVDVSCNE